jgi:hypothetical protein
MLILGLEALAIRAIFLQWSIRIRQGEDGTSAELTAHNTPKK